MIDELVEHVGSLVAGHATMAIKIAGPCRSPRRFAGEARRAARSPSTTSGIEVVDVRVIADETMIETRLKAWIDLIGAENGVAGVAEDRSLTNC